MNELNNKLIDIQSKLKAPKGQYNDFGNYKYRSAEDILEAVKPLNAKHGLLLTLTDKPVLVGDWNYIEATATLSDGTNAIVVTAYARESETKKGMDHSQITGTASSYARKYALNGLYLIDDTKDADTNEYKNQNNQQPALITREQVGELKVRALKFAELRKRTEQEVYEVMKISNIEKLTSQQANAAIKQLDVWIKGADKNDDTKAKS